jgi:hypothetical protein
MDILKLTTTTDYSTVLLSAESSMSLSCPVNRVCDCVAWPDRYHTEDRELNRLHDQLVSLRDPGLKGRVTRVHRYTSRRRC